MKKRIEFVRPQQSRDYRCVKKSAFWICEFVNFQIVALSMIKSKTKSIYEAEDQVDQCRKVKIQIKKKNIFGLPAFLYCTALSVQQNSHFFQNYTLNRQQQSIMPISGICQNLQIKVRAARFFKRFSSSDLNIILTLPYRTCPAFR